MQELPEGSGICQGTSRSGPCRAWILVHGWVHLAAGRCGSWLSLAAPSGTPEARSAGCSPAQGTRAVEGSRALLCLHVWWSPLFVFLTDCSSYL